MRDQYAGDISDYLKFSFLRQVVPGNHVLGVAWYFVPGHDGKPDGRHREYLDELQWRDLDDVVFDAMASIEVPSVASLEVLPIWSGTTIFHRHPVSKSPEARLTWSNEMVKALADAQTVFLDPDNGLVNDDIVTEKHACIQDLKSLSGAGRPMIVIRFPARTDHIEQLKTYHQMLAAYGPLTVRTHVMVPNISGGRSPRMRWFTILNGNKQMHENAQLFAERLSKIRGAGCKIEGPIG